MSLHKELAELVAVLKREKVAHYEGPTEAFATIHVKLTLHPSAFLPEAPNYEPKPREPHPNPLFATDTEG